MANAEELELEHMVRLRDYELLAARMAMEFERIADVSQTLMKTSDGLHETSVVLYERTKMFPCDPLQKQE